MITAAYLRTQAETCFRLARAVKDDRIAAELIAMAEEFTAKAIELDAEPRERGVAWI